MLIRYAWILLGYLAGSISFSYLAGKLIRHIDLRQYGSHTLGGSNVYQHVWKSGIVVVGLLDVAKAALPTWLGLKLGFGLSVALASGIAAILGHNWSIFVGFRGGRGVSTSLGVLAVAFPWAFVWVLAFMAIGQLCHATAVFCLIGLATLPFFAISMGQPASLTMACVAIALIVVLKRLEANGEPVPTGRQRGAVYWRRLWLDRDIADANMWIRRQPKQPNARERSGS
jgi:glycerol-3-phosphate acyltransferase PlsY